MIRAWAVVFAVVGLSLSGCSNEPAVQAGTCIGKEIADANDRAPDLTSVVDCSEPHVYEIAAVLDLPAAALAGKTPEQRLANRTDLATVDQPKPSAQRQAFAKFTDRRCAIAVQELAGYDDIRLGTKHARAALVIPVLAESVTAPWINLMPAEQWRNGERKAICSVRFSARSVKSPDGDPLIAKASTPNFPIGLRQCRTYNAKGQPVLTSCDRQHYSEILFNFSAKVVMGQKFVDSIDPKAVTDMQFAKLDEVCAPALASVMRTGFNNKAVQARATLARWDDSYQSASCELTAVDSKTKDLGPGSLAWTDASAAKLIPVG